MTEQRNEHRRQVLRVGAINFADESIGCMVRNFSSAGAALDVSSPVGIPENFTLVQTAEGQYFPCRVVWCTARRIGVVFG